MRNATLLRFIAIGISACDLAAPANAIENDAPPARKTFVIIVADDLKPAADEWAAYRSSPAGGSWTVVLHSITPAAPATSPTLPAAADQSAQRLAIQQFIRQAYSENHPADDQSFAVLLIGDIDPANPNAGIPVWTFPQTDPVLISGKETEYVSDHPYQLMDDKDDFPDIALGRVPAQNLAEARAVLAKIKRYESPAPAGAPFPTGRNRIAYVAGEGHFGQLDSVLESLFKTMVDQLVPDAFDLSMTYAKATSIYCPPPSKLSDSVLQRMSEGSLLFNYVGHGYPGGFDSLQWGDQRFPILRVPDIDRLRRIASTPATVPTQTPIAFLSCCSTGHFDLPRGAHCMAEALLFHAINDDPKNPQNNNDQCDGPIAVIAGSRVTHPYANTVLQMDITKALLVDRTPTIGLLDLKAEQAMVHPGATADRDLDAIAAPLALAGKWKTGLLDLRKMHARLYNLLGDPATRIALPAQTITDLTIKDNHITGKIEGMTTGHVTITIETQRTSLANESRLQTVSGDNDKDLEAKAANNYALANDRVLARVEGKVVDGRFEVLVSGTMPVSLGVVRAYACGLDMNGMLNDAVGALRIAPASPNAASHPK